MIPICRASAQLKVLFLLHILLYRDDLGSLKIRAVEDLFKDDVLVEEKVDGCFAPGTLVHLADGTRKTIKELYEDVDDDSLTILESIGDTFNPHAKEFPSEKEQRRSGQ